MAMNNSVENNLISIQVSKELTELYKDFLQTIEDLKHANQPISDLQYEQIRKRILDKGNDRIRSLQHFLDFFDFIINKEKVEETARQKRTIVKKIITSSATIVE